MCGDDTYGMPLSQTGTEVTNQIFDAAAPRREVPRDDQNLHAETGYFVRLQRKIDTLRIVKLAAVKAKPVLNGANRDGGLEKGVAYARWLMTSQDRRKIQMYVGNSQYAYFTSITTNF